MDLAELVYDITEAFPQREHLGLACQMRRSAVSVPSNIAEGHRRNKPGFIHHTMIALGSHSELETQTALAFRRRYISKRDYERFEALTADVGRLAHGLLRSLEN